MSYQYAPFGCLPEGKMAARSLSERPTTLDCPTLDNFNSSPMVEPSSLEGDIPGAPSRPPISLTLPSVTLVMRFPDSRSYHSLPMMPLIDGVAPLMNVEWPQAVYVGT